MRPSVKTRSTAENVFELVRADIVHGVLKPADPIREVEIASRLGISRTPVREALLRLENLGLVDIFPQRGTRVAPIRPGKVRAAQLIREAVEVEVVTRAARNATPEDLARLQHAIEDQSVAARRKDHRRFFALDEEFHRTIHEIAGLEAVADELGGLKVHLDRLRFLSVDWPRKAETVIEEHAAIADALARKDGRAAAAAMRTHLRAVVPILEQVAANEAT